MTPLRAQMIYQMQLERLAPKTQAAYVAAVAGLATFYHCAPDPLRPDQMRRYLPHWLVDRHRSWSSCNQVACGLRFFSTKLLGWEPLYLNLPPRPAPSQLPQVLSIEELQRLFTSAKNPRNRVLLMTTYAAGLRVSEVVRLKRTDIESERGLIRVEQGQGRKDRSTLLSTRLLTALRAYWQLYRPAQWLFTGLDPHAPRPIGTAQKISYHAKRTAGIPHGHGIHTLRHCCATHRLEAGVDVRTIQMLLGHQALDTPTRYLRITRQPLATIRSPFDLLPCGAPPPPSPE
jgi:integrase/recombinase XerD